MSAPPSCLVTGGAGFIGGHLVEALVGRGARVRVFDNFSTGRRTNLEAVKDDIEVMEADLRDPDAVTRAVEGVEAVFHLGALPSVPRSVADPLSTHEANITGTLLLLLAARDAGVRRFVFSSSSSVYGDTQVLPKHEGLTPTPQSPYALSKLAGEIYATQFARLYGLGTFSLRYFNVFGPRQDPNSAYAAVIPRFVSAWMAGDRPVIYGDGGQTRDFTFVEDVVRANLCCLDAPDEAAGGVFNVAWGHRISVNDLAARIRERLGAAEPPRHDPPRPGDVRDSQADATRAREILGWTPRVTFEDGLARTVDWFRDQAGAARP